MAFSMDCNPVMPDTGSYKTPDAIPVIVSNLHLLENSFGL